MLQNTTHYWPGLGEPYIFYSLAVSAFPVGEIVFSFAAAFLSHPFPYFYNILFTCVVGGAGGVLYALATNGWMVVAARFLSGACAGLGVVFTQSYIGRTVGNVPRKGRNKKELLFLLYSVTVNISYVMATGELRFYPLLIVDHRTCLQLYIGLSVLVSQFPSVNLYRCGGWFILAITLLYSVLFVIIYSETESLKMKFRQTCLSCGKNKLRHTKRKRTSVKWCSVSFFSEVYMQFCTFCIIV